MKTVKRYYIVNENIDNFRQTTKTLMRNKTIILIFLFIIALLFWGALTARCQDTVTVSKQFVADADKAFALVVEQRKTIENFLQERAKTDAERTAAQTLINSFDALIKVKDEISLQKDRIILMYERVIELQSKIIESLEKRLLKPKSFFQKLLAALKDIALVVTGISIGRGL